MNILVTGVGGDIGQSVVRCLRDSFPKAVIMGCDSEQYAAGMAMVDLFKHVPQVKDGRFESAYMLALSRIADTGHVRYILPTTEPEIALLGRNRDSGLPGVLINNQFALDTFFDKYETVLHLQRTGIPYPATYTADQFDGQLEYPVLLKARKSWGGRGVTMISNQDELAYHRNRMEDAIVQEILGDADHEYTVGVFSDGGKVYSICFRRYLGYGSLSKFVELVNCPETHEIAVAVARSCDLHGSMNIQFRLTGRGFVPFEVNPRISSTVFFRHRFGFRDVEWWISASTGKPVDYRPVYSSGVGVRVVSEVLFDMKEA